MKTARVQAVNEKSFPKMVMKSARKIPATLDLREIDPDFKRR